MAKLVVKISAPSTVPDNAKFLSTVVQTMASSDGITWAKCYIVWQYFLVDEKEWNQMEKDKSEKESARKPAPKLVD